MCIGEWFVPCVIGEDGGQGEQPTACAGCSLTKVDYFRAVLFGGYGVQEICVPNCIRILHMARNDEQWVINRQQCLLPQPPHIFVKQLRV